MNDDLEIKLLAFPPAMEDIFRLLDKTGVTHYALFGGAVRDADYAARYGKPIPINDYDIRLWLPYGDNNENLTNFVDDLAKHTGVIPVLTPQMGKSRIRYLLQCDDHVLDLSFADVTAKKLKSLPLNAVALNRIHAGNIGLCAVAVDATRQAWARPEYMHDRENLTLTVYPDGNEERRILYANKMQAKYPQHKLRVPAIAKPAPFKLTI